MSLSAVTVDPLSDARWRALVAAAPAASPFHEPAWLSLLARTYGYRIGAWAVQDAGDELVAGLPMARIASRLTGRRLVSLPFSDSCPPLVVAGADPVAEWLLAAGVLAEHRATGVEIELRGTLPLGEAATRSERFWCHVISLEGGTEAVQARFAKAQVRRGIAKAQRAGVSVRRATDAAALEQFYALHLRTRRHQGVPTQPKRFIRGFRELFAEGLGWVLLAEWQGRPIAAAVFLRSRHGLVYKYGASDREQLDKRPNNLLFMEAIRIGCAEGADWLDLGRTDLDNDGLRAFKRSWGAEERELAYTRLSSRRPRRGAGLSVPARRVIASSPTFVGRLVGEVLYRHYG